VLAGKGDEISGVAASSVLAGRGFLVGRGVLSGRGAPGRFDAVTWFRV
jgi:hypothetical protein